LIQVRYFNPAEIFFICSQVRQNNYFCHRKLNQLNNTMWQRIQTVFLAIAIISLIGSLFFPIWVFTDPLTQAHALLPLYYIVSKEGIDPVTHYFPYSTTAVLLIASATISIIEIRSYKNRLLQMKLGALNSLFMAAGIGAAVYFSHQLIQIYHGGSYGLALWLPGIAVLCNLLSNRFIRRDERIVRDADRLR
jgi:uncharacterized membrane protein